MRKNITRDELLDMQETHILVENALHEAFESMKVDNDPDKAKAEILSRLNSEAELDSLSKQAARRLRYAALPSFLSFGCFAILFSLFSSPIQRTLTYNAKPTSNEKLVAQAFKNECSAAKNIAGINISIPTNTTTRPAKLSTNYIPTWWRPSRRVKRVSPPGAMSMGAQSIITTVTPGAPTASAAQMGKSK